MISPQFKLDINNELIIDNFAGGGGASTGIELALGRHVDIAINHDAKAIAMHTANHPQTQHYCESVWDIDPREVTQGRPVGLVWLSPDCKHFSKAKGGKPVEKKIRGLAWIALRWASVAKPRVIMLENVEEFITWGPLGPDGKPCKKNKGREFNSFKNALIKQGYKVEHKELRACDFGAPTIRKRLFLIARCDGMPIVWPDATHGDPSNILTKAKKLKPWRTVAECMDWNLPCQSIFERARPLADATNRRIAKGVMRYVVNEENPFILTMAHGEGEGKTKRWGTGVRNIKTPLPTITASGGYGIVAPFLTEFANASNDRNMPADEPLRTQCAQVKGGHFALVAPFISTYYGEKNADEVRGQKINEPLRTQTTENRHALVSAFLIKYYGTDGDLSLKEPLHTITSKDRFGLITVHGTQYQIADIGLRMLAPRELFKAQGFPDKYIIGDNPSQGLTLTKTEQVRMVGNSVCPPIAEAIVRANLADLACLANRRTA